METLFLIDKDELYQGFFLYPFCFICVLESFTIFDVFLLIRLFSIMRHFLDDDIVYLLKYHKLRIKKDTT